MALISPPLNLSYNIYESSMCIWILVFLVKTKLSCSLKIDWIWYLIFFLGVSIYFESTDDWTCRVDFWVCISSAKSLSSTKHWSSILYFFLQCQVVQGSWWIAWEALEECRVSIQLHLSSLWICPSTHSLCHVLTTNHLKFFIDQ